jgi:hypothetical protein
MEPYADWTDVKIGRAFTADEIESVIDLIGQASQMVRDSVPGVGGLDVDERIADGSLSSDTVRRVVVAMVKRIVSVPQFVRQRSVAVDDGSESVTYDSSVSGGEMFISERELASLMGKRGRPGQRAFTVTPVGAYPWT